jgi:hypothetical protein
MSHTLSGTTFRASLIAGCRPAWKAKLQMAFPGVKKINLKSVFWRHALPHTQAKEPACFALFINHYRPKHCAFFSSPVSANSAVLNICSGIFFQFGVTFRTKLQTTHFQSSLCTTYRKFPQCPAVRHTGTKTYSHSTP